MHIPNAAEARRTIESGEWANDNDFLAGIKKKINDAISRGEFRVEGDGHLSEYVVGYLRGLGYRYAARSIAFQDYYTIVW